MRRRILIENINYTPEHIIYYTTNDGNIINVHNYWEQPVVNRYDKENDLGMKVFKNKLTEIPGISGHPFLFAENNLLTLKLPTSVKKLKWGCFYGCENLFYVNVEDLVLEELGYGCFEKTAIKKLDFRNSAFTYIPYGCFIIGSKNHIVDYILCPSTVKDVSNSMFAYSANESSDTRIKTLMIPTLTHDQHYVENTILENLIINKFDGLADLHFFNTDCIIWVPDEWYDGYVEKYTNYIPDASLSKENCQDILNRLRKYSDGVPQFT